MPFSLDEVNAMSGGLLDFVEKELQRARDVADGKQRHMWETFEDDLVGVPEVDQWCNIFDELKINRMPQKWWKNNGHWRWRPVRIL